MDMIKRHESRKSILITGGGGYLGSKLLEGALPSSADFFILDRHFNELSTSLANKNSNVSLIQADLTVSGELTETLQAVNPDLVFHFAALLDRSRDFSIYEKLYAVNVLGTLNLLEALKDVPYSGFYFAGTSEVYGSVNPVPFLENMTPEPLSPYSLSKVMAENLIRTYSDIHNKPWVITRIFNFFGPGMPENTFIPQLFSSLKYGKPFIMTPGEQKRDYLFIDDLIYYLLSLSENTSIRGEIVNICSGESWSMKEIAEHVRLLSGGKLQISSTLPYRTNELWDNKGDNRKLLSMLPSRKLKDFKEGLTELLITSS
ncbi:MAG: NAD-dependent epimerase/dehydratase family protein [Bacteroidales bacterium]